MTIRRQHGSRYFYFRAELVLMLFLSTILTAAGWPANQPRAIEFELRVASMEKVEGWESVPGPGPVEVLVWISPEATLTNADVAQAWPQPTGEKFEVGILLTEEGALKLARLTKSHVEEFVAVMINGRVTATPKIIAEITGGRAVIQGNFTEEEAKSIAEGITVK